MSANVAATPRMMPRPTIAHAARFVVRRCRDRHAKYSERREGAEQPRSRLREQQARQHEAHGHPEPDGFAVQGDFQLEGLARPMPRLHPRDRVPERQRQRHDQPAGKIVAVHERAVGPEPSGGEAPRSIDEGQRHEVLNDGQRAEEQADPGHGADRRADAAALKHRAGGTRTAARSPRRRRAPAALPPGRSTAAARAPASAPTRIARS